MKKTKWFFGTLSLLLAVALLAISFSFPVPDQLSYASEKTVQDAPPYEYQQTKDLVSLVDEFWGRRRPSGCRPTPCLWQYHRLGRVPIAT